MTKEELEKKKNHLAREFNSKEFGSKIDFKKGFDSAVALILPRLEEAEKRFKDADKKVLWLIEYSKLSAPEKHIQRQIWEKYKESINV